MKLIIDNGADVDSVDIILRTPLHLAARGGYLQAVRLLLAYMANPFAKTLTLKSVLDYTKENHPNKLLITYQVKFA